jgi:hypothetical protein
MSDVGLLLYTRYGNVLLSSTVRACHPCTATLTLVEANVAKQMVA